MAEADRQIDVEGTALGSQLTQPLVVVQVSHSWVAVHVSSRVDAVRWDYGSAKHDMMHPKDGWAFFAERIAPLDLRQLVIPGGTTVTALDPHGTTIATTAVPSGSLPARTGGVDPCQV